MTTHLPIPKATGTMPPWRATLLTLSLSLAGLGTTAHAQTQSNADEDAALGLEIATPAAEARRPAGSGLLVVHPPFSWAPPPATPHTSCSPFTGPA